MNVIQLETTEYLPYYQNYINKAGGVNLLEGLKISFDNTLLFLNKLPVDKLEFRYETGKWTVKEVIQHIIDVERIFNYRALRFARADKTPLPGFEENEYAISSKANAKTLEFLIAEYTSVRQSTLMLFKGFDDVMLKRIGQASGGDMSVRALGFVIIGHEAHHCDVIKSRYL